MTTGFNPRSNPINTHFSIFYENKKQVDSETSLLQIPNHLNVSLAGKCAFPNKIFPTQNFLLNSRQY